jgi:hypothetical protein
MLPVPGASIHRTVPLANAGESACGGRLLWPDGQAELRQLPEGPKQAATERVGCVEGVGHIEQHWEAIHWLAQELERKQTLSQAEIADLMGRLYGRNVELVRSA